MIDRLLAEFVAPASLIAGAACAFLKVSGEHGGYQPWLAIGCLLGASLALGFGVVVRRRRPKWGLLCIAGGAFLWIAGFIIPAISRA